MKRYVFTIENGKVNCLLLTETEIELEKRKTTVYPTREIAINAIKAIEEEQRKPKFRALTEEEAEEQREWALSMMTEEEKADVEKNRPKTMLEKYKEQFEYAAIQENWSEEKTRKKRKQFVLRLRSEYNEAYKIRW